MAELSEAARAALAKTAQTNATDDERQRVAENADQWREGLIGLASGMID